jgi:POT family proton-dependent oligopeptide transporter
MLSWSCNIGCLGRAQALKRLVTKHLKTKEFFGHPAGLYVLFLTEMWERFSYYGMRALLIMYMTKYLLADPARAADVLGYHTLEHILTSVFGVLNIQQMSSQLYGLYTGLVYFTPFFGGYLADKFMGQHRTVYLGGVLMAIGHFLMTNEHLFLLALMFLILGNGAFKPNISTQVGDLYKVGDPRRDSAFTIFYMGINLGAIFSPLVCGTLGQLVGWDWGFGAAGVGMLVGLMVYWAGSDLIPRSVEKKQEVVHERHQKLSKKDWERVGALVFLCLLNIAFWAIYEQQGNTLQLWADERTDWVFLGFHVPSSWFQMFNPAMILIFAPLLNMLWIWQAKRGKQPSSITKMGIGAILCGCAYLVMILAAVIVPEHEKGQVFWLIGTVFVFTMGELYLSPIGLSLVTKVAPVPILSTMMGVWFLSSFFGNYMTGYLGTFYSVMSGQSFFSMLFVMGIVTGFLFFVTRRPLERILGREV